MSTDLRNVPDCKAQNELTQTRFWGGKDRSTCNASYSTQDQSRTRVRWCLAQWQLQLTTIDQAPSTSIGCGVDVVCRRPRS